MKPALAFRQPKSPSSWQELPNGDMMLDAINKAIEPSLPKFFGYHLLKIGGLSGEVVTDSCSIKHQFLVGSKADEPDVIADIDDLPFLEQSVDVTILSHALEFSVDPHHVLREASRVLIPNGYMIITGFNPISLAGLNRIIPMRKQNQPWNEHFFTPMRVKDWLSLMGFEVLEDIRCLHTNFIGNIGQGKFSQKWQNFADSYLSAFGSIYIIIAKKRVLPLTPIKPKWKIRPSFQPVKVSTMNGHHTKPHLRHDK
jgi:SAM-dependent methyltransferase